jgi:hypothetical protein
MVEAMGEHRYFEKIWKLCLPSIIALNLNKFKKFQKAIGKHNVKAAIKSGTYIVAEEVDTVLDNFVAGAVLLKGKATNPDT